MLDHLHPINAIWRNSGTEMHTAVAIANGPEPTFRASQLGPRKLTLVQLAAILSIEQYG